MKYSSSVSIAAPIEKVLPLVDDLAQYQRWMPLIHAVDKIDEVTWQIELRAKVGIFARSKRLTMQRTHVDPTRVVFERREADGRDHASWVMEVELDSTDLGCIVTIDLAYGGNLWSAGVLDKILAHQVEVGKKNLVALVAHSS